MISTLFSVTLQSLFALLVPMYVCYGRVILQWEWPWPVLSIIAVINTPVIPVLIPFFLFRCPVVPQIPDPVQLDQQGGATGMLPPQWEDSEPCTFISSSCCDVMCVCVCDVLRLVFFVIPAHGVTLSSFIYTKPIHRYGFVCLLF